MPHTVAYTVIALQELNIFNKYPSIYWNTSCLVVNSGDEGDGTDYAKIAKAIGQIQGHGVNVGLVDINKSGNHFRPSVEEGQILYGLKALSGVGDEIIHQIIENRPYTSMEDFLERISPTKTQMSSLIKAGAFEALTGDTRPVSMMKYIKAVIPKKKRITLANVPLLKSTGLFPEEHEREFRIYEFNRFLKETKKQGKHYLLDEVALDFYNEMEFPENILEISPSTGLPFIETKEWDKIYNKAMEPLRNFFKANIESIIEDLHLAECMEEYDRIASGTISKWEMESMSFYHSEHELANIDKDKYGIVNFSELSRQAEVEKMIQAWGKEIPLFKTAPIVGTVLGKNKTKSSFDILTPDGEVVLVKMNKEEFSRFDRQISETRADGTKKILESSWFRRGNLVLINGYRRGDQFIPKAYKHTPLKPIYLISEIGKNGELYLKSNRG